MEFLECENLLLGVV